MWSVPEFPGLRSDGGLSFKQSWRDARGAHGGRCPRSHTHLPQQQKKEEEEEGPPILFFQQFPKGNLMNCVVLDVRKLHNLEKTVSVHHIVINNNNNKRSGGGRCSPSTKSIFTVTLLPIAFVFDSERSNLSSVGPPLPK